MPSPSPAAGAHFRKIAPRPDGCPRFGLKRPFPPLTGGQPKLGLSPRNGYREERYLTPSWMIITASPARVTSCLPARPESCQPAGSGVQVLQVVRQDTCAGDVRGAFTPGGLPAEGSAVDCRRTRAGAVACAFDSPSQPQNLCRLQRSRYHVSQRVPSYGSCASRLRSAGPGGSSPAAARGPHAFRPRMRSSESEVCQISASG